MGNNITILNTQLDLSSKAKEVRASLKQVNHGKKLMIEGVINAGQHLLEAKEELDHGQFTDWIVNEVSKYGYSLSPQTARRYIQVAESFGQHVAALTDTSLSPSCLYVLSGREVNAQVRQYAITWAAQEDLTTEMVRQLVQQAREKLPKRLADYGWSVHLEQDGFVLRHVDSAYDTLLYRDLRDAINHAEATTKTRHFQLENKHRLNGHRQEPLPDANLPENLAAQNAHSERFQDRVSASSSENHDVQNPHVESFDDRVSASSSENLAAQNAHCERFQDRVSASSPENHDVQNPHVEGFDDRVSPSSPEAGAQPYVHPDPVQPQAKDVTFLPDFPRLTDEQQSALLICALSLMMHQERDNYHEEYGMPAPIPDTTFDTYPDWTRALMATLYGHIARFMEDTV